MKKRMIIMLVLCALVLGGVFGFKAFGYKMMIAHMSAMSSMPETVSTAKVGYTQWQNEIQAVGTLRAVRGADIAPEVSGIVEATPFESGQDVEEGTLLVQLRNADDQARLQALEATLKLAEITLERDDKQLKAKAISQAAYDADKANRDALQAQVTQQKAELDKKTLRAPFAGHVGIRRVDVGQYLNPGSTIVTLQQLDPLFLDFTLPQQALTQIQVGQKITARTDAFEGRVFEGEITALDAKVDEATRNINVRATLRNPDKILRPGLFANVTLTTGEPQSYLTLPQTAVVFNPYGSTVYVVKEAGQDESGAPQKEAVTAFVQTGARRGDQIAILSGIKEGDVIVTAGQLKLHSGSRVIINNSVQPLNEPDPKVKDR